jgi:hypothetical protein
MIIKIISDRANLLDSFVILYSTFVAALYKLKGADLGWYQLPNQIAEPVATDLLPYSVFVAQAVNSYRPP